MPVTSPFMTTLQAAGLAHGLAPTVDLQVVASPPDPSAPDHWSFVGAHSEVHTLLVPAPDDIESLSACPMAALPGQEMSIRTIPLELVLEDPEFLHESSGDIPLTQQLDLLLQRTPSGDLRVEIMPPGPAPAPLCVELGPQGPRLDGEPVTEAQLAAALAPATLDLGAEGVAAAVIHLLSRDASPEMAGLARALLQTL